LDNKQAIEHDAYDRQAFEQALQLFPKLKELVSEWGIKLKTARQLIADLFFSFYKRSPSLVYPPNTITTAYQLNWRVINQVIATIEWQDLRDTGTSGDLLQTTMATIGTAQKALETLDQETLKWINEQAELEAQASKLLHRADSLHDLAEQAQGDAGNKLFDQAEKLKKEAITALKQAEAENQAASSSTSQEEIENQVRRAARKGMSLAGTEIEEMKQTLKAFSGGYFGNNTGPQNNNLEGPNSLKEKLALTATIQNSRRLKEIAALAGRMQRIALKAQESKVDTPPVFQVGLEHGNDLERLAKSELVNLAEPTMKTLFFLRYFENSLIVEKRINKKKQGQGPIIVALDSTGSMTESVGSGLTGSKEAWSKAATLAIIAIARKQSRDIAIIHFAAYGQFVIYEYPKGQATTPQMIECANFFMNGSSTYYDDWMREALKLVDKSEFKKADVILISDGLATISQSLINEWNERRQSKEMRAYSILIGAKNDPGGHIIGQISDAVMHLEDSKEEAVLQNIFSI
jgi:uncharacterized protein with von Willebrand factor type A (vWA) domain